MLNRILTLTEEIYTDAQAGAWEAVEEKQNTRQSLLKQIIELNKTSWTDAENAMVQQMQKLNDQIIALSIKQRANLMQKINGMGRGRTAMAAYKTTTRR